MALFQISQEKTLTMTGKNVQLFPSLFQYERQMEKSLSTIILIHI